ncbi:hypothetical protein J437_LFUL002966 [Ladona fulva]|uniref:Cyclin B n=1 Tax=Ladona fulva TaxID=123851 RepID=A0A8K0KAR6_LADFU|nr:hypothetical protein J437_LFUL002966 [Ladona fulva]
MALQQRNVSALKENARTNPKMEAVKASVVSRPALRPISNRTVALKPVSRIPGKTSLLNKNVTSAPSKNPALKLAVSTKSTNIIEKTVSKPDVKPLNSQDAYKENASKPNGKSVLPKPILLKSDEKATLPKPQSYSFMLNNVTDIDKDDGRSPQLAPPYANDIYSYLRTLEEKSPVRRAYLTGQVINGNMRALLLNWIVEVHGEFKMFQESLHLTVAILDRFLQDFRTIDRSKLQLVGATCLFIAGKYEELFGPDVCDLVYMSQGACTKSEILEMECKILSTLDFSLGRPLPIHFLRRFSKAAKAEAAHHNLAKYIIELGLLEYNLCHHPPSVLAAAALYLSLWLYSGEKSLSETLWNDTLVYYSTYKFSDISDLVKSLSVILVKAETSKFQALRKKYSAAKFSKASASSVLASKHLKKLAAASIQP